MLYLGDTKIIKKTQISTKFFVSATAYVRLRFLECLEKIKTILIDF